MPKGVYIRTERHFAILKQNSSKRNLFGKKHSLETRQKMGDAKKGSKHPRWKGGVTEKNRALRNSMEYRDWRKTVYERDGYKCVLCGDGKHRLEADHIKPVCNYPELIFDVDNGRTLCRKCHHRRTREQLLNGFRDSIDKEC